MNKTELLEFLEEKQDNINELKDEINLINLKIRDRLCDYFKEHIVPIILKNLDLNFIYSEEYNYLNIIIFKDCCEKLYENKKFKEFKNIFIKHNTHPLNYSYKKYNCQISLLDRMIYPPRDSYLIFKFSTKEDIIKFCEDFNIKIEYD